MFFLLFLSLIIESYLAYVGQVYRGSAPAVHLLAQRAVEVGARPVRGNEPFGCHDSRRAGEAVGKRGAEAVPRQAGHRGGTGLVPGEGAFHATTIMTVANVVVVVVGDGDIVVCCVCYSCHCR